MTTANGEWGIGQVLAHARYRWFVLAYFLDELCNAVWLITLGWVIARTDTHLQAAGILLITAIPLTVVLVLCSGWIDRLRSRNVALVTLGCRAALMCLWVLVVATDSAPFALVAVIGGLVGAISGIHEPAMTTYPLAIFPQSEAQGPSVVVERGAHRLTQAVGSMTAGLLLGWGGLGAPAAFGAIAILVALAVMARLNRQLPAPSEATGDDGPAESTGSTIRGGLQFVRAHHTLSMTLSVQCLITVTTAAVLLVTLPFRVQSEGWSAGEYGVVMTVFGVGMTTATLAGFLLQRLPVRARLLLSCAMAAACGAMVVLIGMATSIVAVTVLMGVLGLCLGPAGPFLSGYLRSVTAQADEQAAGVSRVSARVAAVMILATDAMEPMGYAVAIGLTLLFSLSVATVVIGGVCLLVSAASLVRISRIPALHVGPAGHQGAV